MSKSPAGNIDVSICKNGMLYVVGWAFWSEDRPRAARVFLQSQSNSLAKRHELDVLPQSRLDVCEYLGVSSSVATGFSGRAYLRDFDIVSLPAGIASIIAEDPIGEFEPRVIGTVEIKWPQQEPYRVPEVPEPIDEYVEVPVEKPSLLRRVWRGKVGGDPLLAKMFSSEMVTAEALLVSMKMLSSRPNFSQFLSGANVLSLARKMLSASDRRSLIVVLDHNYGGGANSYSKKLIAKHHRGGNDVFRIWYWQETGEYRASYSTSHETVELVLDTMDNVFRLLTYLPSFSVQLNSVWTCPDIEVFLDNVLRLRVFGYTERLEFLAHDHMALCPSLFLMNDKGRYCKVPKRKKVCIGCLKNSEQDFKAYYPNVDLAAWRVTWQSLLVNADLLRFFSKSTLKNFERAYPWLADSPNVVVCGHEVQDIWSYRYDRQVALANKAKGEGLKIGVFGFIDEHKGAHILKSVSQAIAVSEDNTKILIFGSLAGRTYGSVGAIDILGPYAPVELVDLCHENGVDIAWVPSVCPETFSFVAKELCMTGIPVMSFEMGGQAEIVKGHEKGLILKLKDGGGVRILNDIKAYYNDNLLSQEISVKT